MLFRVLWNPSETRVEQGRWRTGVTLRLLIRELLKRPLEAHARSKEVDHVFNASIGDPRLVPTVR